MRHRVGCRLGAGVPSQPRTAVSAGSSRHQAGRRSAGRDQETAACGFGEMVSGCAPRPPFVPGFARPVSGPFPLCRRMLSLTWISVALSLHPKISFLADKHRNAWRSPGEQRRLNISTGHTVPVPSTIAREHSLKTHCCRYRSRVGFSEKPLKVTRYCCSGRAAAALRRPSGP